MNFRRILALQCKQLYLTRRSFDRLGDLIIWPILDLLLWGFVTLYVGDMTEAPVQAFIIGGLILWIFIWRANNDISLFVLEDFWSRNLYNLFSSPMTIGELLLSLTLGGFFRILCTFAITAAVAFALYHFSILSLGVVMLLLSGSVLMLFGWAVGIAISSLFFRFGDRIHLFSWGSTFLLLPFSCVLYPLAALPPWAQPIAKLLPTTQVFESMRAVLSGQPVPWLPFGIALLESLIFLIIAVWLFGLGIKRAKQTGLLTKY
ncbi:MAG TPA: ABC transporter permease [Candidatus Nanoarchaeia archaeon]|nr:ABC transporter permease [Candidatus Nanoarchaeia archaeon]